GKRTHAAATERNPQAQRGGGLQSYSLIGARKGGILCIQKLALVGSIPERGAIAGSGIELVANSFAKGEIIDRERNSHLGRVRQRTGERNQQRRQPAQRRARAHS